MNMQPAATPKKPFLPIWLLGMCLIFLPAATCCGINLGSGGGGGGGSSTPTAVPPTATPNLVIYQDALDGSTKADWNNDANCFFGSDGYHVKDGFICYAPSDKVGDGVVTVTVKQISGPNTFAYGLVFRRPSQGNYYDFQIDSNGKWIFDKVISGKTTTIVDFTANSAIHTGLNTANTISVKSQGSHFVFSVNGTQVGTADDTTFTTGDTGLAGNDGAEVVFTNLLISKLSA